MAITLANDVIIYRKSKGLNAPICSLDTEGGFRLLYKKPEDIISDQLRTLVYDWYSRIIICSRWNKGFSECIPILKGTSQTRMSSPFLFNLFYQDVLDILDSTIRDIYQILYRFHKSI